MRPRYKVRKRALYIRTLATVYIMRLGPRVLWSLDPNWQDASKTFSSLTESADLVKVRMAATSFHILAVGRNGAQMIHSLQLHYSQFLVALLLLIYHPYPLSFHEMIFILRCLERAPGRTKNANTCVRVRAYTLLTHAH